MSIDSFKNEKIIMSFFLNYFIALTFDKVVNVRITLAKTISKIIIKKENPWILENEDFKFIINKLKTDKNNIVNSYFKEINIENNEKYNTPQNEDLYTIIFDNRMSILKEIFGISRNLPLNSIFKQNTLEILKEKIPRKNSLENDTIDDLLDTPKENGNNSLIKNKEKDSEFNLVKDGKVNHYVDINESYRRDEIETTKDEEIIENGGTESESKQNGIYCD